MIDERLLEVFTDALDRVRDTVVGRYKARTSEFVVDPGEIYSDVDWANAMIQAGVPEAVAENIIANAAGQFGFDEILEAGFDEIDIRISFTGSDVRVTTQGLKANFSQVIQEHVDSLESYSSSIRSNVQDTVDNGIRTGLSVDDIGEQLFDSGKFSEASARAFAQTETVAASNGTAYAGYPDDVRKQWIYTRDDRVRPTHEEAGKQDPVPMKDLFTVGNATARYPGDPNLPPGERIWCRCTLAPVVGDL